MRTHLISTLSFSMVIWFYSLSPGTSPCRCFVCLLVWLRELGVGYSFASIRFSYSFWCLLQILRSGDGRHQLVVPCFRCSRCNQSGGEQPEYMLVWKDDSTPASGRLIWLQPTHRSDGPSGCLLRLVTWPVDWTNHMRSVMNTCQRTSRACFCDFEQPVSVAYILWILPFWMSRSANDMHYLNMRMVSSDQYSSDDSGITVSSEDLCRTLLEMPPPPPQESL